MSNNSSRVAALEQLETDLKHSVREGTSVTLRYLKMVLEFGVTKEQLFATAIGKTVAQLAKRHPEVRRMRKKIKYRTEEIWWWWWWCVSDETSSMFPSSSSPHRTIKPSVVMLSQLAFVVCCYS